MNVGFAGKVCCMQILVWTFAVGLTGVTFPFRALADHQLLTNSTGGGTLHSASPVEFVSEVDLTLSTSADLNAIRGGIAADTLNRNLQLGEIEDFTVSLAEPVVHTECVLVSGGCGGPTGDMNYNDRLDSGDIAAFALALKNKYQYEVQFGYPAAARGDFDGNGLDFDDIDTFWDLINSCLAIPEPSSLTLMIAGVIAIFGRRPGRRRSNSAFLDMVL
jgi:hypothetical protein